MYSDLVERFCTVPFTPLTDYDAKAVASAERFEIPFEEQTISCYSWGSGKTVLLVHGWGSRASHLVLPARTLSASGFKTIAFDMPAHTSVNSTVQKNKSNMFEFSKAISAVAKSVGPVYAIIGHSLGAASSVFAVAGHLIFSDLKTDVEKLVLVSSPISVRSMIKRFCKINGLNLGSEIELVQGLDKDFNFCVDDYFIPDAIQNITSQILVVHDADDEEISIDEAQEIAGTSSKIQTIFTSGSGHYKILVNRTMLAGVKKFLLK